MRTWKLKQRGRVGYDEMCECVVRAGTEQQARELAAKAACDEGPDVWLDPMDSTCVDVADLPEGVVCTDVQEG